MSDAVNFFKTDLRSIEFTLYEHLKVQEVFDYDYYSHLSRDECDEVIRQTMRFCNEVTGPLNTPADRVGCRVEPTETGNRVVTPDGYPAAWKKLYELGLPNWGVRLDDGGFQGPVSISIALAELQSGANVAFSMYPGLTRGAAELVAHFGLDKDRDRFLPGMLDGRFSGTMCLSEPQAGSDVGASTTKATLVEGNTYKIKGSKCWISGGDHDMGENVVHLVLARVEGAPKGTGGISLFIVPKFRVADDGSSGDWNDVTTASIEHKLGINSSTTAVLNFGDNDDCIGFLCGADENVGMKQMFHMMNGARIEVGVQGLAIAATAYYNALAYARERKQGSSVKQFKNPDAPRVAIIEHSDVRRMLLEMKSRTEGMRALAVKLAKHQDLVYCMTEKDPDAAVYHQGQVDLLTPIVKAYCSDQSFRVCELAVQTYGGAGYVKDNPVEQYLRDSKIFSIYEGTNHIQALDLVVRKLRGRKGQDLADFAGDLTAFVERHSNDPAIGREAQALGEASLALQEAGATIVEFMMTSKLDQLTLCATSFLEAMADVAVAHLLLEQAVIAEETRTQDDTQSQEEFDFYAGKVMSGKFYANFILPNVHAKCRAIRSGDRSALDIPDAGFSTTW
ncbi:MAG: alkylation response protein AidB-like acyl-CoA dehydrogenase [Hyphomicrobiaceae bacterium]|jgi:alkylation response protein AidB-like acyl-CoA dehydrogenase